MSDQMNKEIVLKFRGDTKDLKKTVKDIQKDLTGLDKGSTVKGGMLGISKEMESYKKLAKSIGGEFEGTFSRISKSIKTLVGQDLKMLERSANKLAKEAEGRMLHMGRLATQQQEALIKGDKKRISELSKEIEKNKPK
jgi:hypothetical protein